MKTVIISGSRNPEGQTAQAAKAYLKGFIDAGGEGEIIYLPKLQIDRCRQCEDSGWGLCIKEGRCVIDDDLAAVAAKVHEADVVALANPVYYADISESLRAFLDRFRRVRWPKVSQQQQDVKPVVLMCVAGGSGGGSPECIQSMEKAVRHLGFDIAAEVPAKRQDLQERCEELYNIGKKLAAGQ